MSTPQQSATPTPLTDAATFRIREETAGEPDALISVVQADVAAQLESGLSAARAQLQAKEQELAEAKAWETSWAKSANDADDRLKAALQQLAARDATIAGLRDALELIAGPIPKDSRRCREIAQDALAQAAPKAQPPTDEKAAPLPEPPLSE